MLVTERGFKKKILGRGSGEEGKGGGRRVREGVGEGGEMTQTLYAI
jgi:hypothetical protein